MKTFQEYAADKGWPIFTAKDGLGFARKPPAAGADVLDNDVLKGGPGIGKRHNTLPIKKPKKKKPD